MTLGQGAPFALQSGDRVLFYGDSITEQQYYTRDVELYALTRMPSSNITFVMSGVSGDKVSGGGGGPVDLRLPRDVFDLKPTVVTIMLGMNDGYYRPFEPGTMLTYERGYEHILDEIKAHAPEAKVVVLRPSAYDEVTQPGHGTAGYNDFLIKMGDSVARMAAERHLAVVDLNAPMVTALTSARAKDPVMAAMLIGDHVHPGPGMHWVMADAVLKGWGASPVVTSVTLGAAHGKVVSSVNTSVTEAEGSGKTLSSLSWVQLDRALPLPLPVAATDPVTDLALRASTVVEDLDQEMLTVGDLAVGRYELRIDDAAVGTFTSEELRSGVNLARLDTPMRRQAMLVFLANEGKISLDTNRNHLLRNVPSASNDESLAAVKTALQAADAEQRRLAQPVRHRYALVPVR
ncbi:SGNH/GDSL hydrolase family protein [Tunturibacter empetritectus]|uniref:SGNH/GDSL hydrolase family protein n=1 Tax=Tunturiibacter empetritectus TaxID=3069691 RepID=A0AAU7Z930_9BACT